MWTMRRNYPSQYHPTTLFHSPMTIFRKYGNCESMARRRTFSPSRGVNLFRIFPPSFFPRSLRNRFREGLQALISMYASSGIDAPLSVDSARRIEEAGFKLHAYDCPSRFCRPPMQEVFSIMHQPDLRKVKRFVLRTAVSPSGY